MPYACQDLLNNLLTEHRLLYHTHMVTIEVGEEKEHFVVHQSFLCVKSPYFDKALSGSFQEATTRFIRLPEISPILFRIFVAWLYHGSLSYLPLPGRTIDEDFKSLEVTEENLEQSFVPEHKVQDDASDTESDRDDSADNTVRTSSDAVVVDDSGSDTASATESVEEPASSAIEHLHCLEDDPTSWSYHVLIQLYVLADYFQIRELKADCLDALVHARRKQTNRIQWTDIKYIYNETPADSPLRKYVVHEVVYREAFIEDGSSYAGMPAEFLAAALVASSRRLPVKLCSNCYKEALEVTPVSESQHDERHSQEDLPPYETDLCFYHEHPDDEEREACRLRRKTLDSHDEE